MGWFSYSYFSATQDITIDALRIEQIKKDETSSMAAGAAMAVVGWWTGFKLGGYICLEIAERLEISGVEQYWQVTFIFLMAIIVFCNVGLTFIPESNKERFQEITKTDYSNSNFNSVKNAGYLFGSIGILCFLTGKFFEKIWFTNGGITFVILGVLFYIFSLYIQKFGEDNPISQTLYYLNNVIANPLNCFFNINCVKIGITILAFVFLF